VVGPELAALVEANAWSFGPVATALRVLEVTLEQKQDPAELWEPLLAGCPRMAALGYWLNALRAGALSLPQLAADCQRREAAIAAHLAARLGTDRRVLLVGHDREIDALWALDEEERTFRYLLLEGPAGTDSPGAFAHRHTRLRSRRSRRRASRAPSPSRSWRTRWTGPTPWCSRASSCTGRTCWARRSCARCWPPRATRPTRSSFAWSTSGG
jgi:hypothetical protein